MDTTKLVKIAKIAYEAYIESSGGKNYRGDPCPTWDELPPAIQGHWQAAVRAVQRVVVARDIGIVIM